MCVGWIWAEHSCTTTHCEHLAQQGPLRVIVAAAVLRAVRPGIAVAEEEG
jgi:hypothetical protein